MALIDAVRAGVATANKITSPGGMQGDVTYERFRSKDGRGATTYFAPVTLAAVISVKQQLVKSATGEMKMSTATIMFLDLTELAKVTENAGLDIRDKITLPDGTTGVILSVGGFMDPGTSQSVAPKVYLG